MKAFVSSTVYDLIDIRAELDALLRELHVSPILSDQKLSDFHVTCDANSIETCLLNVESSDVVLLILDQRYGPRLGKYGFDDISATHLEYRHAKAQNKPIYVYVRDRLEADYTIFRKNKAVPDFELSWIQPKDRGLFDLLQEHRELHASSHKNNWFSIFTNVLDLKQSVRRHFEPLIRPQVLLDAIQQNRFPLFVSNVDADQITLGSVPSLKCCVSLKNVSLSPAFNFKLKWQIEDHELETRDIVAPGDEINSIMFANLRYGPEIDLILKVHYETAIGITVCERYKVYCLFKGGASPAMLSGASLLERTYHNGPMPNICIKDQVHDDLM